MSPWTHRHAIASSRCGCRQVLATGSSQDALIRLPNIVQSGPHPGVRLLICPRGRARRSQSRSTPIPTCKWERPSLSSCSTGSAFCVCCRLRRASAVRLPRDAVFEHAAGCFRQQGDQAARPTQPAQGVCSCRWRREGRCYGQAGAAGRGTTSGGGCQVPHENRCRNLEQPESLGWI